AAALAALHAGGVIHCDVKLDNVLVLDGGATRPTVKVVDFGVSRLVDDPEPPTAIAGTPASMAPEQWRCAPVPASDVYALCCVLYELLTGAPLFDGSLPEIMAAHLEQRPPRPSWLRAMPDELERVILRALAKDPAHRPTMADLADELARMDDQRRSRVGVVARGSDAAIDVLALARLSA
ncbi:MAG: serine/threonine-protein kinase, partial [Proteobacteria bacterium]|nr:serine/threonine-protein kinase [Pseudomonadota bacterium]